LITRPGGHKVGPIVFILGANIAKYKDIPYGKRLTEIGNSKWPPRGFFGSFLTVKMTHLPLDHHSVYRKSPIVFILSEHVANYDNMPYIIFFSKWPPAAIVDVRNSFSFAFLAISG